MKHRQTAVAGVFYPGDRQTLTAELRQLFANCKPSRNLQDIRALIVPHAGYLFSGEVAASAYNQLAPEKRYKRIFILASSHRYSFDGASVFCSGHYLIPGGKVKVDLQLASRLVEEHSVFQFGEEAHEEEHSLEVQLPFLQYKLGKEIEIIPIILGTQNPKTIEQISGALKPYFTAENLFVVSSDFSHYPPYEEAKKADEITAMGIVENNPQVLLSTLEKIRQKNIPGLVTALCGWSSVLCLLYLSAGDDRLNFHRIQYKNSGDEKLHGNRKRVVGYQSLVLTGVGEVDFVLSDSEKIQLLKVARQSLVAWLNGEERERGRRVEKLTEKVGSGAFVSLYRKTELRGCIGRFTQEEALIPLVDDLAVSSANDYRFETLSSEDLPFITIEISVLSPLKRIESIDELELGKHGIYIRKGAQSGTFLPQVADKTGWSKEEFVSRCSHDKAHLGSDGWKTAELYIYEAIVFSEKDFNLPVR